MASCEKFEKQELFLRKAWEGLDCYFRVNSVHFIFVCLKTRWLLPLALFGLATMMMRAEVETPIEALSEDELIYRDGDRLRGHLVSEKESEWVFHSKRFGELRVSKNEASVIQVATPENLGPPIELNTENEVDATTLEETEGGADHLLPWDYLNPTFLTNYLREVFGPWKGRFSVSTELVSDTTDRSTVTVAAKLRRKWERDDVELNVRYDYTETENITTRDFAKLTASWRHDFESRLFALYIPAMEWNRNYKVDGVVADYLLLQQEVGAGVSILNRDGRQLRLGVSENRFDVWVSEPKRNHEGTNAESIFVEAEWELPWRITLTERGVYYYDLSTREDGWENKFQIDKKLTETLSVGVLHELRYNNPDVRVSDYELLKLLIGLDF